MKQTIIIILLVIPALSIGIFYFQKQNRMGIQTDLRTCKDLHMECVTERDYLITDMENFSQVDLQEYLNLKNTKEKYLKADELVAKAVQIFLVIQGLRLPKEHVNWAYNIDSRKLILEENWNKQIGEDIGKNESPIITLEATPTEILLKEQTSLIKTPAIILTKGRLKRFWNKRFRISKDNASIINQNELSFLKGKFVGNFIDINNIPNNMFFKLSYATKSSRDPKVLANIFIDAFNDKSKSQVFHLNNTFKIYRIGDSNKYDFYVLKNSYKGIELHLFHFKQQKYITGKIYVPSIRRTQQSFKLSTRKLRKVGEIQINLK